MTSGQPPWHAVIVGLVTRAWAASILCCLHGSRGKPTFTQDLMEHEFPDSGAGLLLGKGNRTFGEPL